MLTKTQQVVQSCRLIQKQKWPLFSEKEIVARFIYEWFHTTEEYVYKAVGRRLEELWKDWQIIQKVWELYRVTPLGMNCVLEDIHLRASVFIGKKEISYERVKKPKSDRIRKSRSESEVKSENKVLNNLVVYTPPIETTEYQTLTGALIWWVKSLFIK